MTAPTGVKPTSTNLRVPPELWEQLRLQAFQERTSINAWIVQAIRERLERGT